MRLISPLVGRRGLGPRVVAKANEIENPEEIVLSFGREKFATVELVRCIFNG